MKLRHSLVTILLTIAASGLCSLNVGARVEPVLKTENGHNRPVTTILISIDGFRHDYLSKYQPRQLLEIATSGLRVERFLPIYPSKSFPNHLSIITGSYSARHGLVHNEFYSKSKDKLYRKGDAGKDPSWLTAVPLWILSEQQGLHSAVIFWPEAAAKVAQTLPQDLMAWQRGVSDQQVLDKVISTISRPVEQRPDFIAGYLSSVDMAGHRFGPGSSQVADAIAKLDRGIARLRAVIAKLDNKVNLIFVSDHGMSDVGDAKALDWQDLISPNEQVRVINAGTQLMISARHGIDASAELQRLRAQLMTNANNRYRVLSSADLSKLSHVGPNVADIICEVISPYIFSNGTFWGFYSGNHGWDVNNNPDMAGFMVASGPSFKSNQQLDSVENIHLYPLLAAILGLEINHPIDGKLSVLAPYLESNSE